MFAFEFQFTSVLLIASNLRFLQNSCFHNCYVYLDPRTICIFLQKQVLCGKHSHIVSLCVSNKAITTYNKHLNIKHKKKEKRKKKLQKNIVKKE